MNTPTQKKHTLPVALAAVMALILTTACGDRPIVDVSQEEDGRPILRALTATGNFLRPQGDVTAGDILIADFDFSVTDGFARGEAPEDDFEPVDNPFGAANAYNIGPSVPGSNLDVRSPAVTEDDVEVSFWGLFNPGFTGVAPGAHDFFGEISGLKPNTTYSVVLARASLTVNGELDHNQILTGRSISDPDALNILGGTPTGYPDVTCDFSSLSPVTASTNPVMLGTVTTDADGVVTVDCIPYATGDSPWYRDDSSQSPAGATDPDSMPFGANQAGATLAPGQFNYAMLFEGVGTETDPIPAPQPAVRIQIGPDIDASGNVINNSFAPFPSDVADVGNLANLPGGANAFAAPGTLTLDGVGFMAGPTFEIGVYSRESGSFTPVNSRVVITDTLIVDAINGIIDTLSVDTLRGVSTFTSPRGGAAVEILMDADDAGVDFGANSHVVARMSGTQGSEFLYQEYLTADKALQNGATSFGAFNPGGQSTVYTLEGQGEMRFFGDSLLVNLSRVTRNPPAGFHYQSYLIGFTESGTNLQRLHAIELDARGNGQDRIGVDELNGDFGSYNLWVMVPEPNGGQLTADGVRTLQTQVSEDYFSKFSGFFTR